MNMDVDTTTWLTRFIGDKHGPKRRIYIEDDDRFGRVAVAADGYMMAIARADEGVTGVPHPLGWTRVIPALSAFSTNVTVRTEDLVRAIMRADVVARHTQPTRPTRPTRRTRPTPHPIHLVIEPRQVRVRAEAHDVGQIETVLDAELDGSPVTIVLDAKRVLTILRGWSSVSNGKRQRSSTLDGADETIIRVGQPDEIIMIQPADVTAAGGRFAILVPLSKPDIEVIEPAYSAHSRKETCPAEPSRPTSIVTQASPSPSIVTQASPSPSIVTQAQPMPPGQHRHAGTAERAAFP